MIPLRDSIPSRSRPYVEYAILALTSLVFLYELLLPERALERFASDFGVVPARVTGSLPFGHPLMEGPRYAGLVTAALLHAGWLHFLGNMWFLRIFGDNVEDHLGHGRFLVFYVLCAVAAGLSQVAADPASPLPMIGASGAVAGVMGAYFVLFPRSKVLTVVPIFFFLILEIPAISFLGIWFLLQFLNGTLSSAAGVQGGVAFWAHAGGFLSGILVLGLLGGWRSPQAPSARWRGSFSGGWRG